jgi:hypothetical protein
MNYQPYLIGGIIYAVLAIVLGMIGSMLPINLAPYAVLIAALIAGIYIGMKELTPAKAAIGGVIVGVIGGIIAGIIASIGGNYIRASTGVPYLDVVVSALGGMMSQYVGVFAWYIAAGIILGGIGGFIGKKIKK